MMEKLIYEGKEERIEGIRYVIMMGQATMLLGSILFFISWLNIGTWFFLFIMGLVLMVLGLMCVLFMPKLGKATFRIYDKHIEGTYFVSTATKAFRESYYYTFEQITGLSIKDNEVTIHSVYKKKNIRMKDSEKAEEVYQYLEQMVYH